MPALEEGQTFERYIITRWLGSGVSGESYEAEVREETLQQKVTLKVIHPWAAPGDSARRQFFREMQGIGRLSHPYLASVLDYGEINGRLYVARRYTSSGSLLGSDGRLWFRPPLTISDAIVYGHQLAMVLEYIHGQGYLHGTLTFANILVLRGPNVEREPDYAPFLLADVGLANFVRRFGQPQITLLPITAAPEQLGKRVTPASDQFALAVLIFSWIAGRPPYLGSPEEVEQQKLSEAIAPLHSFNPEVTDEQETVLRRALAVYPEERYPSILAFADALLATLTPQTRPEQNIVVADAPSIMPACIIINSPYSQEPVQIMLEGDEITIGRAGSSDILLDYDALTSRHHALLKREGEHYVIYDRRSISGVFVNGQKLVDDAGEALSDGDLVRIGNYELRFRSDAHKVTDETNQASADTSSP